MDSEHERLLCKIEKMAKHIQELETTLDNRECENAKLADKIYTGFEILDSVKKKQNQLFHAMENKKKELIREIDDLKCTFHTRSSGYQEEIECLKYWLEKQDAKSEELENRVSIDLNEIATLQKRLLRVMKKSHDGRRQLKSELRVKDRDIICIQTVLIDKITENAELENQLSAEQDRKENLQSSVCELKIKYEKDVWATQAEMTGLAIESKHTVAKLEEAENRLQEALDEIVEQKAEFERTIRETREALCKGNNKLEEENGGLMASNKSLISKMACITTKICDSLMENNTLKCQLADQHESIKLLEATNIRLHQKKESIEGNEETSENVLMTEREQHSRRQQQICENKLEFNTQDDLEELRKKLAERIKCLTNSMTHEDDEFKI